MTERESHRNGRRVALAAGALAGAALALAMDGAWGWPVLLLPLSLACFAAVWSGFALAAVTARAQVGLFLAGVFGGHLCVWLPFLVVSYLVGQGLAQAPYALAGALVTAAAVGWYVLSDHLWPTLVGVAAALVALRAVARRWEAGA